MTWMTWSRQETLNKKVFIFLFLLFVNFSNLFADEISLSDEWVLGAKKFEFLQNKKRELSEQELSTLIPQLLLEKISEGLVRNTSKKEMLDRTLESYLVERQALFLKLLGDYKKRDSLVLFIDNKKKLEKAIKKQQLVIDETEKKIEENLQKTEQIKLEYSESDIKNNEKEISKSSDYNFIFNPFSNLFVSKKDTLIPDVKDEKVVLYKKDSSELFLTSDSYKKNGIESRSFEKEILDAKINGLIDGTLTIFGEYFSVTCSLYIYPGRECLGTITEVGKIRNCESVVHNLSSYFCPLITNHKPIEIYFDIEPKEIVDKSHITVDGIYYEKVPEKLILDAGNHNIKVECNDYWTRMISYDFIGSSKFLIQADMIKIKKTDISVALVKPEEGKIYADGKFAGDIFNDNVYGKFTSDGESIIGYFMAKKDAESKENKGLFFYVPEKIQTQNEILAVNGKVLDHASYINERRIWTYRAYSLLVLSMPWTLYSIGKYNSAVYAYNASVLTDLDEVKKLERTKNISLGITAVCTTFFVVELIRYLVAANSVLPVNAHKASNAELIKAEQRAKKIIPSVNEIPIEDDKNTKSNIIDESSKEKNELGEQ